MAGAWRTGTPCWTVQLIYDWKLGAEDRTTAITCIKSHLTARDNVAANDCCQHSLTVLKVAQTDAAPG